MPPLELGRVLPEVGPAYLDLDVDYAETLLLYD